MKRWSFSAGGCGNRNALILNRTTMRLAFAGVVRSAVAVENGSNSLLPFCALLRPCCARNRASPFLGYVLFTTGLWCMTSYRKGMRHVVGIFIHCVPFVPLILLLVTFTEHCMLHTHFPWLLNKPMSALPMQVFMEKAQAYEVSRQPSCCSLGRGWSSKGA